MLVASRAARRWSPTASGRARRRCSAARCSRRSCRVGGGIAAGLAVYAAVVLALRIPEARQIARPARGRLAAPRRGAPNLWRPHGRPGAHPQLLDHRPHRPRQVDAGRPHPRAHAHRRPAQACAPQLLDSMDLERERGITIKAQAVRVFYEARDGETYQLHLIDTPGHVDFTYEVSRSLAACEGALLVVDASQGVEAQTRRQHLPGGRRRARADPVPEQDRPARRRARARGRARSPSCSASPADDVLRISRQDRRGRRRRCSRSSSRASRRPTGDPDAPPRALIFDSEFDQYRGVIAYIRVVDGTFEQGRGDPRDGRPAPRPTSTTSASSRPQMTPVDGARAPARSAT